MVQAVRSNSIPAPEFPPPDCANRTLNPDGLVAHFHLERITTLPQRRGFAAVFICKQMIADEVERLLAILDAIDGDDDFELSVANGRYDPRLEDCEGDAPDDEASLAATEAFSHDQAWYERTLYCGDDLEDDPADAGIADHDGLTEQIGGAA